MDKQAAMPDATQWYGDTWLLSESTRGEHWDKRTISWFSEDKLIIHIQVMEQALLALVQHEPDVTADFRQVTEIVNSMFAFYDQNFPKDGPDIFDKQEKAEQVDFEELKAEHELKLEHMEKQLRAAWSVTEATQEAVEAMIGNHEGLEGSFDKLFKDECLEDGGGEICTERAIM